MSHHDAVAAMLVALAIAAFALLLGLPALVPPALARRGLLSPGRWLALSGLLGLVALASLAGLVGLAVSGLFGPHGEAWASLAAVVAGMVVLAGGAGSVGCLVAAAVHRVRGGVPAGGPPGGAKTAGRSLRSC